MKKRMSASGQETLAEEMKNAGFSLPANEVYTGNLSKNTKVLQEQGIFRVVTSYIFMTDTIDLNAGHYNCNRSQLEMRTTKSGLNPARYTMMRRDSKISAKKGAKWSPVNWRLYE